MNIEKNMKGEWIWRTIMSILLGVVGWYAQRNVNEQQRFNEQVHKRVTELELDAARVSGNRFTSVDWVSAKAVLDANHATLDKRITRTEDAIIVLKETLPRMERKLDNLNGQ